MLKDDDFLDEVRAAIIGYDTLLLAVMLATPETESVHQPERDRLTPLLEKIREIRGQ